MSPVGVVIRDCLFSRLRKLSRSLTRLYDREMKPVGLGIFQFAALASLHELGDASTDRLSQAIGVDRTTLLRNLGLLRRRGWVSHVRSGKSRVVRITPEGIRKVREGIPQWTRSQLRVSKVLGRKRLVELRDMLDSAIEELLEQP
jgi:DNA-binding MarR family transcriptional regulator